MRRRPPDSIIVTVLAGLGMFGPFSTDTIFPAFAQMGSDLAASPVALQQLVSVYLIAVSYTHLDVYKRQDSARLRCITTREYCGAAVALMSNGAVLDRS